MARRFYANFAPTLALSGAINAAVTSFTVATNFSGWPASTPFYAVLEYGTSNAEVVLVTNVAGSVATVTRGQDGTTAVSHAAGSTADFAFVKADLDDASAHINASSAVHGVAGTVVGTSDSQTLSNKSFSDNLAIGGTLAVTGAATVSGTLHAVGAVTADAGITASAGNISASAAGANVTANNDVVAGRAVLGPGVRLQARYGAQVLPASSTTVLGSVATPAVAEFDTLGFVTTTGVATIPTTGTYEISAQVYLAAAATSFGVYKNGSLLINLPQPGGSQTGVSAPLEFSLTAGDTIDVRVVIGAGPVTVTSTATTKSYLRIKRTS